MDVPGIDAPPALPFGMLPYGDDGFERMHAAGSMLASASGVPAIFNLVPQRFGKLSYALHLNGERRLPDISKEPHIRVGHALEPVVAELLSEELGAQVRKLDGYAMHKWLPMFSTPDGVVEIDGVRTMVEIKVVTPKVFWKSWRDGPPVHVGVQHQCQYATTGAEAGIIAVFNLGWCSLEFYPTAPHRPTIERNEIVTGNFMDALADGRLPDPDDTEADFEAFREIMWQSADKTILIPGEEATRRASQYAQAKLDEAAATRTIQANKRWFQGRMADAQVATLDDGSSIQWRTNKTKSKDQDRPNRVFKIKETNGEDDG